MKRHALVFLAITTLLLSGTSPVLAQERRDAQYDAVVQGSEDTDAVQNGSDFGELSSDESGRVGSSSDGDEQCIINGDSVPCDEIFTPLAWIFGFGAILIILGLVFALAVFIFWLVMLIHSIANPIKDRRMWIAVHIVAFLFGLALVSAIVYYFVVKQPYDRDNHRSGAPHPSADGDNDTDYRNLQDSEQ